MTPEEIRHLEMELENRQAQFDADFHEKRSQLSEDEYKKLIESHKRELTEMKEKLDYQKERQRQTLLEKLAARRVAKGSQQVSTIVISVKLILGHGLVGSSMYSDFFFFLN